MASSSSSLSSAISIQEKYDVFLSFRGEDTRNQFASYLYAALSAKHISTFMDDHQLERGDEISPTLRKAIHESKIWVIIFSENFASSTWCLDELAEILECKKRNEQGTVMPIFYGIDPSAVRKQEATTALTFLNHKELKGQSMRIMRSQRYPLTRKTGIANLFVKNLHPSFTSGQLQSMFSKFGRILSCKVASENGNSKGFGFVQFDSKLSAMTARNALHGTLLKGKKIYVSKFVKKSVRTVANGETMKASLQGQNKQLFIARAQQEEIVNCHTEKLKASSLPAKNSTHPVHYSSFYSLGKDLIKQRQQINTGKQSFKSESSVCGNNFVQDT